MRFAGGHQRQHRPGRLESRALGAGRRVLGFKVAVIALAPAAIRALRLFQPSDGPAYCRIIRRHTNLLECSQDGPGAIDIVGAPTAVPRTGTLLLRAQVGDNLLQRTSITLMLVG